MTAPTVTPVLIAAPKRKVALNEIQVDAYLTNGSGDQLWRVAKLKHASTTPASAPSRTSSSNTPRRSRRQPMRSRPCSR